MSLASFAIRMTTVRAIRAAVWSDFVVADSPQRPLGVLESGKPLIAVYTGHDTDKLEGNELFSGDPKVSLAIQIFLPAQFAITVAGQALELDTTDEGAETLLDVVERRINGAFLAQAEPWSCLRATFITRTVRTQSTSYLVESEAVRTSAREMTLECETVYEPIPGAPPCGMWADLIALMRTDTGERSLAPLADWIAAEILGPSTLTQDERDRIDLGLSAYAATVVGILPIVRGSEIDLQEVDVASAGDGGPLPITMPAPPGGAPTP